MPGDDRRVLRSTTPKISLTESSTSVLPPSPLQFSVLRHPLSVSQIRLIPPGSSLPNTTSPSLRLLRQKQSRLSSTASTKYELAGHAEGTTTRHALLSTLIFAQYEAGTAVCVDPDGWILTCSHCFGESEAEWYAEKRKWLLFYTGLAVLAECRVWDSKRDLALCRIVAVEASSPSNGQEGQEGNIVPRFSYVQASAHAPTMGDSILCIGQPGRDDLESSIAKRTKYDLVEISEGQFRGMVRGADPQDNSEIGTLKHDAWTYWGHSGAPLVRKGDGTLIGLHSSWDDTTAMRHGIPLVAIKIFLQLHLRSEVNKEGTDLVVRSKMAGKQTQILDEVNLVGREFGAQEASNALAQTLESEDILSQMASGREGKTLESAILIEDDSVITVEED